MKIVSNLGVSSELGEDPKVKTRKQPSELKVGLGELPKDVAANVVKHFRPKDEAAIPAQTIRRIVATLATRINEKGERRGLYSAEQLEYVAKELQDLAGWWQTHKPQRLREADALLAKGPRLSHRDSMLTSYPENFVDSRTERSPFENVVEFVKRYGLSEIFSTWHSLPYFESSVLPGYEKLKGCARLPDGGYSPNSTKPDPYYGDPDVLEKLWADGMDMMSDLVLVHFSDQSEAFQRFLEDDPEYADFFVTVPENADLSKLMHARQHNPVQVFQNSKGESKRVLCRFSRSQPTVNWRNPKVFVTYVKALVGLLAKLPSRWVRMDAVGYLVFLALQKGDPVTSGFHLEETHSIVKAFRTFFDHLCPSTAFVAEINDEEKNFKPYYGTEEDPEVHLCCGLTVPGISLYTCWTGNARHLMDWIATRKPDEPITACAATHDGFPILPINELADPRRHANPTDKDRFLNEAKRRGAIVNFGTRMERGKEVKFPYEFCFTFLEAVLTPEEQSRLKAGEQLSDAETDAIIDRYVASCGHMYTIPHAVPDHYANALIPLFSDEATYEITGKARYRNRGVIDLAFVDRAMEHPQTSYERIVQGCFSRLIAINRIRGQETAFSPTGSFKTDLFEPSDVKGATAECMPVCSILRQSDDRSQRVLLLTNVAQDATEVTMRAGLLGVAGSGGQVVDLLTGERHTFESGRLSLKLRPNQMLWLKPETS